MATCSAEVSALASVVTTRPHTVYFAFAHEMVGCLIYRKQQQLILVRLVGIMLQISIIILFRLSLKISSLCSILFFYATDSIIILHLVAIIKLVTPFSAI